MPRLKFGLKSRPKPVSDLHTPAVQYKRLLRHCFSSLNTVELLLRSLSQKKRMKKKKFVMFLIARSQQICLPAEHMASWRYNMISVSRAAPVDLLLKASCSRQIMYPK